MYILGLHTSHDTSACLLKDGEIIVAIEKERLTRHKHQWANSSFGDIVNYCLQYAAITLEDVDHIVVNDINNIFRETVFSSREVLISHHLAHAWAAIGLSTFSECAILILDGEGSKVAELDAEERNVCSYNEDFFAEKESCYQLFAGKNLKPIKKWTSGRGGDSKFSGTDATGSPYWILSQSFFNKEHQESKIMGLASYGQASKEYQHIYGLEENGSVKIDERWIFDFNKTPKNDLKNNFQVYADIAAAVQDGLEKAIIHKAKWLQHVTGSKNLCFSGGVALNCVANAALSKAGIFENVFIPFGPGDSSIAIGCAYYGWHVIAGRPKVESPVSPYLGKHYSSLEIEDALEMFQQHQLIQARREEDYIADAAKKINAGNIVAWFQGRSEFGPRALGNRSILANPSTMEARSLLNQKVKFREYFRPFAPVVLEDLAAEWFDNLVPGSDFMQFTADVKKEQQQRVPAITHIDGSARVQTVSRQSNEVLHELISAFNYLSGIPLLLNTSFNIQEPIVETPLDALLTFVTSSIDYLYLENYRVQSFAKMVSDKQTLLLAPSFIIFLKPLQLRLSNGRCSIQQLSGQEKIFKFGNYYQISNFPEFEITKELYVLLQNMDMGIKNIFALSSDAATRMYDQFDEVYDKLIKSRLIALVHV
jgi:carbamoyltransferase